MAINDTERLIDVMIEIKQKIKNRVRWGLQANEHDGTFCRQRSDQKVDHEVRDDHWTLPKGFNLGAMRCVVNTLDVTEELEKNFDCLKCS